MPLIKLFCCLDVYLKLYSRLKLSRVNGLFLQNLHVLFVFSCLIYMDLVAPRIFFNLYGFV
jgi:hypothetical protein